MKMRLDKSLVDDMMVSSVLDAVTAAKARGVHPIVIFGSLAGMTVAAGEEAGATLSELVQSLVQIWNIGGAGAETPNDGERKQER